MIINVDTLKDQLINGLWLPIAKEAGDSFCPRLKKNKNMKLFTLTNGINLKEIVIFEKEKLIQRKDAFAWVSTPNKRWRLESESVCFVLDGDIYSNSFLDHSSQLQNCFPLDIINFDFSSQDPYIGENRIEKEIENLEKAINLQNQKACLKFVLIYTTIIDSKKIDKNIVIQTSNARGVNGCDDLNINKVPQIISDKNSKYTFIKEVINKICQKHGYVNFKLNNLIVAIPDSNKKLYSISGIFER